MLIVVLVHTVAMSTAQTVRLGVIAVLLPSVWYVALALGGASGEILSPVELAALVVAPWIVLIVSRSRPSSALRRLVDPRAMMVVFGITAVGLSFVRRPEVPESLANLVRNGLMDGGWGPFWWLVIGLAVVPAIPAAWPPRFATERNDSRPRLSAWVGAIGSYVLVVAVLGAVRSLPYRTGWDDSGNRMLVHVAPTVVIALVLQAVRSQRAPLDAALGGIELHAQHVRSEAEPPQASQG
jgi:hypothetical protein